MLYHSLYIFGAMFIIGFSYQAYRLLNDVRDMKTFHYRRIFDKIFEWYEFADIARTKHNFDTDKLKAIEVEIDKLLDTKIMKPSTLSFNDKFISEFLFAKKYTNKTKTDTIQFENIARLDLKKTRQGLKIFSLAFGVKFTLENYSLVNYWTLLKGNYNIFSNNRIDQAGRKYTWQDVEEPYGVLVYYFNFFKLDFVK